MCDSFLLLVFLVAILAEICAELSAARTVDDGTIYQKFQFWASLRVYEKDPRSGYCLRRILGIPILKKDRT